MALALQDLKPDRNVICMCISGLDVHATSRADTCCFQKNRIITNLQELATCKVLKVTSDSRN